MTASVAISQSDQGIVCPTEVGAALATAGNTGCTSVGDCEITVRISAVAVCCSSDSRSSVNKRTFSMAITACAAKLSRSAISYGARGSGSMRATQNWPRCRPSVRSGTLATSAAPLLARRRIVDQAEVGDLRKLRAFNDSRKLGPGT